MPYGGGSTYALQYDNLRTVPEREIVAWRSCRCITLFNSTSRTSIPEWIYTQQNQMINQHVRSKC